MDNMVPIGRFSRMTRLSIKALRFYDEIGLLRPAWVDPSSSYRYYRLGQANQAEAIRILRSVEMPVDEIKELLATDQPNVTRKLLDEHRRRLADRLAHQERTLAFLEALIEREEGIMPYEVTVARVEAQQVAAFRTHTTLRHVGDAIGRGFGAVMSYLGRLGIEPAGPPLVVFHDVIDEETQGEIEMCIPIAAPVDGEDGVRGVELPGGLVATTVHRGPYGEIAPAYHTLTGWIQEHGHEMAGPPREVYLNDPTEVGEAEQLTRSTGRSRSDLRAKVDYKREVKHLYTAPSAEPVIVEVPELSYLMVEGRAIPIELMSQDKSAWIWTMMILQPDEVSVEQVEQAATQAASKKPLPGTSRIRLERLREGAAAQILHVGPFSAEKPTIDRLHDFIASIGYERIGKHHEIYLGDPRRTPPEKLRTIIRQPIHPA